MTTDTSSLNRLPDVSRELKTCGHHCFPSNLKTCCSCEDLRPLADGYEAYVDGVGYTMTATRDDAYCPVCNTNNYDKWIERVEEQTRRKQREDDERHRIALEQQMAAEEDRAKNSDKSHGRVKYSSGNVFVGDLLKGEPHGTGRMDYADNDMDIIYYQGEWANGKHQGKGKKVWMDDMWYEGEFKNGMMHGQGICRVNEVDVMEGRFEADVFQD